MSWFFQLPLLTKQSIFPLTTVSPSRMGTEKNQVGPGLRTLSPYRIQVKTLFNLSISGSQMSSLLFNSSPQEVCFLRTACPHCKKFQKRLAGLQVMWYVPSSSQHLWQRAVEERIISPWVLNSLCLLRNILFLTKEIRHLVLQINIIVTKFVFCWPNNTAIKR